MQKVSSLWHPIACARLASSTSQSREFVTKKFPNISGLLPFGSAELFVALPAWTDQRGEIRRKLQRATEQIYCGLAAFVYAILFFLPPPEHIKFSQGGPRIPPKRCAVAKSVFGRLPLTGWFVAPCRSMLLAAIFRWQARGKVFEYMIKRRRESTPVQKTDF